MGIEDLPWICKSNEKNEYVFELSWWRTSFKVVIYFYEIF